MKTPKHVAIIMDGNGRWAAARGLMRMQGHREGVKRVEELIRVAPDYGIKYITLYAFSKENWNRPKIEVAFLMRLLSLYLDRKRKDFMKENVVFNAIGRLTDLPKDVQKKIARNIEETKSNTRLTVNFCFSYSSRLEITEACQKISQKVKEGTLQPADITEQTINDHLYTSHLPDPDLLIRTSGELRISNFLLWQISYAELYITEKYWPEFNQEELEKALEAYSKRKRRFGLTEAVETSS